MHAVGCLQAAGSPTTALAYVLSCRSLCAGLHMELVSALATTVLAELSLQLGSSGVAGMLTTLRGIMPLVLGQGSIALQVLHLPRTCVLNRDGKLPEPKCQLN